MTDRLYDIWNEAGELWEKARYYDAAVMYEQARQIARELRMAPEAAEIGIVAALCWEAVNRPMKALSLLIEILASAEEELSIESRWNAQWSKLSLSMCYSPNLAQLKQQLDRLSQLQREYPQLPIDRLHHHTGDLYRYRGMWYEALREYEIAWTEQSSREEDFWDWLMVRKAQQCHLYLGNLKAAQNWSDVLFRAKINTPYIHLLQYQSRCELAIYQRQWLKADNFASQVEETAIMMQDSWIEEDAIESRVRTLLLQPKLGDPAQFNSPARFRLRQRYSGKLGLQDKYSRYLRLVDYRLACVRYSLHIHPVDDSFYRTPQKLPTRLHKDFSHIDFQQRVQLTQRAIHRVISVAKNLDNAWQSTWRQEEVKQRQARLNELIGVTHSLLT